MFDIMFLRKHKFCFFHQNLNGEHRNIAHLVQDQIGGPFLLLAAEDSRKSKIFQKVFWIMVDLDIRALVSLQPEA